MSQIVHHGRLRYIVWSWASLIAISTKVGLRRIIGKPLEREWSFGLEVGNLFWRRQFMRAMAMPDLDDGRAYFDSLQTYTDEVFEVECSASTGCDPKGNWITPRALHSKTTLLYLHGGGYTFHAAVSYRHADMLAAILRARVFAPDYRLTPEHPHPAQIEDSIATYRYLLDQGVDPSQLVIIGDSAGGHLTLMTLIALRDAGLPQPALAIGLCPWTDIGARGDSLFGNDRYDLVQGYMTLQFGEWLKGNCAYSREELSPMNQDFRGLAPIYLQGGGREILIDMIRDFAARLKEQGCDVMLDVWSHMTHNFHAHGATRPESLEALERIRLAIDYRTNPDGGKTALVPSATTELCNP